MEASKGRSNGHTNDRLGSRLGRVLSLEILPGSTRTFRLNSYVHRDHRW
jgi:hypothetical protein